MLEQRPRNLQQRRGASGMKADAAGDGRERVPFPPHAALDPGDDGFRLAHSAMRHQPARALGPEPAQVEADQSERRPEEDSGAPSDPPIHATARKSVPYGASVSIHVLSGVRPLSQKKNHT